MCFFARHFLTFCRWSLSRVYSMQLSSESSRNTEIQFRKSSCGLEACLCDGRDERDLSVIRPRCENTNEGIRAGTLRLGDLSAFRRDRLDLVSMLICRLSDQLSALLGHKHEKPLDCKASIVGACGSVFRMCSDGRWRVRAAGRPRVARNLRVTDWHGFASRSR